MASLCRLLVSGAIDATVSLFELETLTCLRTFSKFDHPARGVSFSADSSYIAYYAEGTLGVNIEKTFSGDELAAYRVLCEASRGRRSKHSISKRIRFARQLIKVHPVCNIEPWLYDVMAFYDMFTCLSCGGLSVAQSTLSFGLLKHMYRLLRPIPFQASTM